MVCIDNKYFALIFSSAVLIISGVILTDRALDNNSKDSFGTILFILGWMMFIAIASLNHKLQFKKRNILLGGLPAFFVAFSAIIAQTTLKKDKKMQMAGMGLFSMFWIGLAVALSYRSGKFEGEILSFTLTGAVLIIISMMILMKERRFNLDTGKRNGPSQTYSFGLPAFVTGWISVCVGMSLY